MGAPIVINKQQDPWSQYLPQLLFMKIRHNMEMEQEKLRIDALKAEKIEGRAYTEGQEKKKREFQLTKEGNTPVTPSTLKPEEIAQGKLTGEVFPSDGKTWRRPTPQLFTLGGKNYIAHGNKLIEQDAGKVGKYKSVWSKTKQSFVQRTDEDIAQNPDEYGMTKATATGMKKAGAPQISIGEKEQQKNLAYFKSPQFNFDVKNQTMKKYSKFDWEDMSMADKKQNEIETADAAIRQAVPGARYGYDEKQKQYGWFNNGELVAPWSFDDK